MVHAPLPRLDDRGRLDRDHEESNRRAHLRPPLRSAAAQARRGRGVVAAMCLMHKCATHSVRSPPPQGGREQAEFAARPSFNLREALFAPRSVAIVGQSDDAGKATGRPLQFLRQAGYGGRIYPVNPRRETVLSERAWPSLAALPEPPDHAYIVTATEAAVAAVEECGRAGVKVATVLADGFAEIGAEGLAREQRLRDTCARTRIRLVGPSSLGVVDLRSKAMLTAN